MSDISKTNCNFDTEARQRKLPEYKLTSQGDFFSNKLKLPKSGQVEA